VGVTEGSGALILYPKAHCAVGEEAGGYEEDLTAGHQTNMGTRR